MAPSKEIKRVVESAEQAFINTIAEKTNPTNTYEAMDFSGYLEAWLSEDEEWNKALDKMEEIIKEVEERRRTQ